MKTAAQEFADELRELRAIVRDYGAMKAERDAELPAWYKARRELVDMLVATRSCNVRVRARAHGKNHLRLGARAHLARLATAKPTVLAGSRAQKARLARIAASRVGSK